MIGDRVKILNDTVTRKLGQRDVLVSKQEELSEKKLSLQNELELYSKARKLLELFVRSTEYRVREYIEPIVTEALDFVFDQGLKFHLLFVTRRNQVEVDFLILRDEESEANYQKYILDPKKYEKQLEQLAKETRNINYMYGGAVNQVLALVLRLVLVELLQIRGPVFLDEPSSAVGEEYSARLGQLVSSLSERFKRQIVLITHSKTLASFAEKIYSVNKVHDVSMIEEIEA